MSGFQVGDVVRLKSGGPPMTVTEPRTHSGNVAVNWFPSNEAKPEHSVFPGEALKAVDMEKYKTPSPPKGAGA